MKSRSIVLGSAVIAALSALASSPAVADEGPRLPAGWIRGADRPAPQVVQSERRWGSFQSLHEASFGVRASIPGGPVDLAALPVVAIEPSSKASSSASASPSVGEIYELPPGSPGDVAILKNGARRRISINGFEAGQIRIGKANPVGVGRQSEGGVANACGPASQARGVRTLTYEAIRRVDSSGSLELVWARGYLDMATCRASIVERNTAKPKHLGGGVVYAFLTRCVACAASERDVLHVLTPQMEDRFDFAIPFEHRTLALAPGKSGAFEGASHFRSAGGGQDWGIPDWHGVIDAQCKAETVWCLKSVRLEVSQAIGEPRATVFLGGDLGTVL